MLSISFFDEKTEPAKRNKGKSRVFLPSDYVVIDIETTGLSSQYDEIIEVALIKFINNIEIDRLQTLIKPSLINISLNEDDNFSYYKNVQRDEDGDYSGDYYVDEFISKLTGITNEMLETAPSFEKIAQKLYDFIGDFVIVGQNVNFDINFLYDNFKSTLNKPLSNDFVDILRLTKKLFPNLENHKLPTLAKHFNINIGRQHRALDDCTLANAILNNIKKYVLDQDIDLKELFYNQSSEIDLTTLVATENSINPNHIFYKKNCLFTGKLDKMTREQAAQLVVNIGGFCQNGINKNTNFLILGNFDYVKTVKNGKSNKQKTAEKYILAGKDLQIINEDVFYELILEL